MAVEMKKVLGVIVRWVCCRLPFPAKYFEVQSRSKLKDVNFFTSLTSIADMKLSHFLSFLLAKVVQVDERKSCSRVQGQAE